MESLGPRQGVSVAAVCDMTDHRTLTSFVKFSKQAERPATRQHTCWTMDSLQLSGLPPLAWHTVGVRFIVARLIVSRGADMDESRRQPFVLKSRKPIPGHVPDPSRVFDPKRQLWILRDSGLPVVRSEEHTSELQSLMRISYAVFCLKTNK